MKDKFLWGILPVAFVLLFLNLGNIYLWQDEAETALIAKNILHTGLPKAWDGVNIITQQGGADYNENYIWIWHPWLQHYIAAISFLFLGISTFSARFPFTAVGFLSIICFYVFAKKMTDKTTARISTILFLTSIPFLLHARQCRWYMLAVFGTIWCLDAYIRFQKKDKGAWIYFALASIFLFHSNYLNFIGLMSGIFIHFLIFNLNRENIKKLSYAYIVTAFFTLPWFIYAKGWLRDSAFDAWSLGGLEKFIAFSKILLTYCNDYIYPFALLLLLLLFRKRVSTKFDHAKSALTLLVAPVITTFILIFFAKWIYFRFILVLIPLGCLLVGITVNNTMRYSKWIGWAIILLLIFSNVFSINLKNPKLKFNFIDYLYEITHDYDGPNEGIVTFLNKHKKPGDTVVTNYGNLPIIFYTGLKTLGWSQNIKQEAHPDWIIIRDHRPQYHYLTKKAAGYKKHVINYPDLFWANRPDPYNHYFKSAESAKKIEVFQKQF